MKTQVFIFAIAEVTRKSTFNRGRQQDEQCKHVFAENAKSDELLQAMDRAHESGTVLTWPSCVNSVHMLGSGSI